jgi:hypothetical protein
MGSADEIRESRERAVVAFLDGVHEQGDDEPAEAAERCGDGA